MRNPYDVLGVPQGASIDQVNAAYRELARKYQSEAYTNGQLSGVAEKKMQELNDAYDAIVLGAQSSASSQGSASSGGYSRSTYNTTSGGQSEFADIRAKIKGGRLDDAQILLDGTPGYKRNAEWYYLKGTIQQRRGWLTEAAKNFEAACNMDPQNSTYRAAYENVNESATGGFRTERKRKNGDSGCSACDICSGLLCADCCCECFGGDCIPCC